QRTHNPSVGGSNPPGPTEVTPMNRRATMSPNAHHDLQGLRALVTGATAGLGRVIALRLASDGAEVVLHGRDAARGAQTVEAIRTADGKGTFVQADLSDPASAGHLAEQVGEVDILVNNASFWATGPTAGFDVTSFDAMFVANVRATFVLVAAMAPRM